MTEEEISELATKLIKRFDNTRIIGADGEWSGDARQGFMFNPKPKGPGGVTPPAHSGACCYNDGTCAVVTPEVCEAGGGSYQGDGTDCDPNPCGGGEPTGACCYQDGTCMVVSESECEGGDGIYQGDDTSCFPDPCPCAGATFLTANFAFSYDDGEFSFSGSGIAEDDLGELCSFSKTIVVPVTVHDAGNPDCSPPADVSCAVDVTYLGGGSWSLNTQVLMLDHSTVCGIAGFPSSSISSSLVTSFSGFTTFQVLNPDTFPPMTATIDVALSSP